MSSSQDNEGNAVVRMLPRSRSEIKRAYLFLKQQLRRMGALHLLILRRERKEPLLHTAVKENRRDVVELLILIGVSPDVRGISWSTPLHEAAARGYVDILQLLLQHGADINAETSMGRSALFLASSYRHHEAVSLLLRAGADFYFGNEEYKTCDRPRSISFNN
nr:GA-binding protein subunit beta-1-like isoform X4 [Halyomorpha halys]